MRLLVHGESVRSAERLRRAVRGLAARGHAVTWCGAGAPEGVEGIVAAEGRHLGGARHDLAIGGDAVAATAALARQGLASAIVAGLSGAGLARLSWLDRTGWDAQMALALIEEGDAEAARHGRHGIALDRFALWPAVADAGPEIAAADTEVLERAAERALARARGPAPRAAFFVDRDGTLIVDRHHLGDPAGVELLAGVAEVLRAVRGAGHPVVVVSNQAGVGRGRYPLAAAHATMARLRRLLRREGVELDAVHFCPHRPEDGCACRKPGTQLFQRAAEDLQLHLPHSVMVGDKRLDAAAGVAMGGVGLLVETGYAGREEDSTNPPVPPERVHPDLASAAAWFLGREEARVIG
jgi:histidinol-phosphate phosphatase family protein